MKLNGAAIVTETLISHGVTDVFGFPGGTILHLYDELYKRSDRLRHLLTCHEQGAAHAADGYARATGKTGVVIATSGPGATNLVTGLATAYLDSVPMVAITGNVASPLIGKDSFQEVDIAGITMPITKHNYIVGNVDELEGILCEAFHIARSGRPGPVLVDIPKDIQSSECEFFGGRPLPLPGHLPVDESALNQAAKLITNAKRPYIYVGGGVIISGAYDELCSFAEKIDAPVGFSMMGLSAMNCYNPRKLGMTGMHGTYAASKMRAEADLIIGVGVRFSDRATGNLSKYRERAKILHIDIDRAEINKNVHCDQSVLGNIRNILPALCAMLKQQNHPEWNALGAKYRRESEYPANEQGFSPREIIQTVRQYTSDETVIATDVGQHQMWTAQHYGFVKPRTFLTSGGLGAMGFGLGAAIGACIAKGGARTVLFTGDGSFHMNLAELATAVTYRLPLVIAVMNNGVLGMVRQWQGLFYEQRYSNTTLERATDYVKLAEAFGATGFRAASLSELSAALQKAFGINGPVVIDCVIGRDEKVLPMIPPGGSVEDMILR